MKIDTVQNSIRQTHRYHHATGKACTNLPARHQPVQHAVAGQEHEHSIRHHLAHRHHAAAHAVLEGGGVCMLVCGLQHAAICPMADSPCPYLPSDVYHVRSLQFDWKGCAQLQSSQKGSWSWEAGQPRSRQPLFGGSTEVGSDFRPPHAVHNVANGDLAGCLIVSQTTLRRSP